MSKFQTVFASGLFLLSSACTSQVQTTKPVPTSPITSSAPTTVSVSQTATTKGKNLYPPDSIANYLDVCSKSGNSKAYCNCSINKAQDLYPLNEFSEAYALAASGKKSEKMDKVVSNCTFKQTNTSESLRSQCSQLKTIFLTNPPIFTGYYPPVINFYKEQVSKVQKLTIKDSQLKANQAKWVNVFQKFVKINLEFSEIVRNKTANPYVAKKLTEEFDSGISPALDEFNKICAKKNR